MLTHSSNVANPRIETILSFSMLDADVQRHLTLCYTTWYFCRKFCPRPLCQLSRAVLCQPQLSLTTMEASISSAGLPGRGSLALSAPLVNITYFGRCEQSILKTSLTIPQLHTFYIIINICFTCVVTLLRVIKVVELLSQKCNFQNCVFCSVEPYLQLLFVCWNFCECRLTGIRRPRTTPEPPRPELKSKFRKSNYSSNK